MLEINVSQLLKSPIGTKQTYKIDEAVEDTDIACAVQGEVKLTRTNRGILASASLHTEAEVTCSRCLTLFRCPLVLNFEEEYFPTIDIISGAPVPVPDEPGGFTIDEHHILDLTEAIRQYALLAIPMKPLCHEDCAGLCPQCGCNLNLKACDCSTPQEDPRWFQLTALVKVNKRKGTER